MRKINSNINLANTLEGEFYNSHSSFMQSVDNIFANNWLIVTDTRNLNEKQMYIHLCISINYYQNLFAFKK